MRARGFFLGVIATLLLAEPASATGRVPGPALIAEGRANVSLRSSVPDFPQQQDTWRGAVPPGGSPESLRPEGTARLATIETTAPLPDRSDPSVRAALKEAVESAVRGAIAMDFSWVEVTEALVLQDRVTVRILATDTEPEGQVRVPIKGNVSLGR